MSSPGSPPVRDRPRDLVRFVRKEAIERAQVLRLRAAIRGRETTRPRAPIFIVGCPRSGTTYLFDLLRRHSKIGSLNDEGHRIWNVYRHPRERGWDSDRVASASVDGRERRYVYGAVHEVAGERTFLDKTPKNVLRLPHLTALFPDARFVFIKRDGRATVASLIEGWTRRAGLSYRLPQSLRLEEYRGRLWSYILPPGWRSASHSSFAEIAALQYVSSNELFLQDRERSPSTLVRELFYEELVRDPVATTKSLLDDLGLEHDEAVLAAAGAGGSRRSGSSLPKPEKWRRRSEEIDRVWPAIAPVMRRLGYSIEHD